MEHSELVVELAGLRGQVATWQAQATQATHDHTQAQHRADKLQQVHTASNPYTDTGEGAWKTDALNVQLTLAMDVCALAVLVLSWGLLRSWMDCCLVMPRPHRT